MNAEQDEQGNALGSRMERNCLDAHPMPGVAAGLTRTEAPRGTGDVVFSNAGGFYFEDLALAPALAPALVVSARTRAQLHATSAARLFG